jgi:hypothetical protein
MEWPATKQIVTPTTVLFAAVYVLTLGLCLNSVIDIYGRFRYMPVFSY